MCLPISKRNWLQYINLLWSWFYSNILSVLVVYSGTLLYAGRLSQSFCSHTDRTRLKALKMNWTELNCIKNYDRKRTSIAFVKDSSKSCNNYVNKVQINDFFLAVDIQIFLIRPWSMSWWLAQRGQNRRSNCRQKIGFFCQQVWVFCPNHLAILLTKCPLSMLILWTGRWQTFNVQQLKTSLIFTFPDHE